jgi:hypothetical protein
VVRSFLQVAQTGFLHLLQKHKSDGAKTDQFNGNKQHKYGS